MNELRNNGDSNTGNLNTGHFNTGDRDTGDWNTGNGNTGDSNTGNMNTGFKNTGNSNTGSYNTGNYNAGHFNVGFFNVGNGNTGDWNKSSYNTGCFNMKEHGIMLFDKPSNMTYEEWKKSDARCLLKQMLKDVVEWVWKKDMTDEEKLAHLDYKTTGGYLKVHSMPEYGQQRWNALTDKQKEIIKSIPNFDADIFKECTGIDVNATKSTDGKISSS